MALVDDLRQLSEQVRRRQAHIRSEEATKQALILPFLKILGYDVYDPTEVQPEYIADFAKKKSGGQMEKVDYAVHLKGAPAIFIECKAADVKLEDHGGQLARYFNATPSVRVGVLTNGIQYRFFTDLGQPNVMNASPFFEFDMLSISERDAETLLKFQKNTFDAEEVHPHAESLIYVQRLTKLVDDLLREPSESFIRFLIKEIDLIGEKKVMPKVVEKFIPIVKKAIQTTLLDMATRSIKQQTEAPAVVQPEVIPAAMPQATAAAGGQESGRLLSPEEAEVFETIKRICADSPRAAKFPLLYKTATNHFAINIGASKYMVRVFAEVKNRSITVRVPVARAAPLCPGFQVVEFRDTKSRIYYSTAKDIERLRPVILLAYEEAIRMKETAAVAPGANGQDTSDAKAAQ